jgi:RNA polymerase sigma-70 factor, ECF subfamily
MAVDDEPAADGSPDESVLLRRCGRRDEDAFGVLYERHADGVLRYLGRITGDVGAAEELAQETFFLMWEKAKRIKCVNGSVFPWLYTTAKYLAANHLRKKGNQHMLDIDRMDIGRVLAEVSTEEKVIAQDTLNRVHRAVSAMPEADQRIFLVHFVGGRPHGDIAKELGLTKAAVKNRVLRLRNRLKNQFSDVLTAEEGE